MHSNVAGFVVLLQQLVAWRPGGADAPPNPALVFASSSSVYGAPRARARVTSCL